MTTLGTACAGGRFPRGAPSTVARGTFVLVSAMMLAPVTAMPTASDSTTMYSFEKRSNTHFQGIRWQNALGFLAACCGVFCGMVLLAIILKFANPPHMEARHHTQGMYQYPVQGPPRSTFASHSKGTTRQPSFKRGGYPGTQQLSSPSQQGLLDEVQPRPMASRRALPVTPQDSYSYRGNQRPVSPVPLTPAGGAIQPPIAARSVQTDGYATPGTYDTPLRGPSRQSGTAGVSSDSSSSRGGQYSQYAQQQPYSYSYGQGQYDPYQHNRYSQYGGYDQNGQYYRQYGQSQRYSNYGGSQQNQFEGYATTEPQAQSNVPFFGNRQSRGYVPLPNPPTGESHAQEPPEPWQLAHRNQGNGLGYNTSHRSQLSRNSSQLSRVESIGAGDYRRHSRRAQKERQSVTTSERIAALRSAAQRGTGDEIPTYYWQQNAVQSPDSHQGVPRGYREARRLPSPPSRTNGNLEQHETQYGSRSAWSPYA